MARCDCAGLGVEGCMCALQAGDNVTVTGTGQALDPWVVSGIPPAPYTEGTAIDIVANAISVDVSTDVGNQVSIGGDGGLFVPSSLPSGGPIGMLAYTTVGTTSWTKAANPTARWLRVRVVAGGGGSASTGAVLAGQGIARGGGAGGGYAESWLDVATLAASVTVTVGAGGIAGSPAGTGTAGGNGGASSFGTHVVANGGLGSSATTSPAAAPVLSPGAAPGALGTGDITVQGASGESGLFTSAAVGGRLGGMGGASAGGLGAAGYTTVFAGFGTPGKLYGGGASGSVRDGAHAGQLGTSGGQGIVIVEMFS